MTTVRQYLMPLAFSIMPAAALLVAISLVTSCSPSSSQKPLLSSGISGIYRTRSEPKKSRELKPDGTVYFWGEAPGGKPNEAIMGTYEVEGEILMFKIPALGSTIVEACRVEDNKMLNCGGERWMTGIADPARMAANQASAVGSLRTINTSEVTYSSTYPNGFSPSLASLGWTGSPSTASSAGLIDGELASGVKNGYKFTYVPGSGTANIQTYSVYADPVEPGASGQNHYFTDQSGVIRQNTERRAGPNDPPLAG